MIYCHLTYELTHVFCVGKETVYFLIYFNFNKYSAPFHTDIPLINFTTTLGKFRSTHVSKGASYNIKVLNIPYM